MIRTPVPLRWHVPVDFRRGRIRETVLLDGTAEIAAGRCGEPVKLNLGGVGYYRVQYDDAMRAALAGSIEKLAPADRVNLLADDWAMAEAGRATPATFSVSSTDLPGTKTGRSWSRSFARFRVSTICNGDVPGAPPFRPTRRKYCSRRSTG